VIMGSQKERSAFYSCLCCFVYMQALRKEDFLSKKSYQVFSKEKKKKNKRLRLALPCRFVETNI
jgi:hypothetical protein